jgi:uncharacterized protein (TIGR00299 family) protein
MVLGALLDLGLPIDGLRAALGSLAIEYGSVSTERVLRSGISATRFLATADPAAHEEHEEDEAGGGPARHSDAGREAHGHGRPHVHPHRAGAAEHRRHHSLKDITEAIGRSALSAAGRARAIALFETLAIAESEIHDVPVERIHLHEVGALDSIIDIVGAVHGMEWLGVDEVIVSPLNVGSGTVTCAHGEFPVPAPATARILRGAPIYAGTLRTELVTPTGALLMTAYASRFGALPPMRVSAIGYGAGAKDFVRHPNVLRVLVGETDTSTTTERVVVLECEIDDMNPQLFGPLMDRLYATGALDVFFAAVQMKKNRPGTLVTAIAPPERREALAAILFTESTTIGVRFQEMQREKLDRELRSIETPVGPIRFKIATRDGRVLNASPEFEDLARAAGVHGLSIKDVQAVAVKAWLDSQ